MCFYGFVCVGVCLFFFVSTPVRVYTCAYVSCVWLCVLCVRVSISVVYVCVCVLLVRCVNVCYVLFFL